MYILPLSEIVKVFGHVDIHGAVSLHNGEDQTPVSRAELDVSDGLLLLKHVLALPGLLLLVLDFFPDVNNLIVAGRGDN